MYKKSLGAAILLGVSLITLDKFTRSHTDWLFTLYLSGYRYADGSPNPFIKTSGICPSLTLLSLPHMTACSSEWPKMAPILANVYVCVWVCVSIYMYKEKLRKSLLLQFGANIHHCQPAYTLHMPPARPISPPIAGWRSDRTAHLLIYKSAAVRFVLFTNVNALWMKPLLGVLCLWRTQAKWQRCSHGEPINTSSNQ